MTLFDALCHQWRQRVRSPTWGRSLIGALLLVLAAGYFGVLFVALGWFFPEIVAEVAPSREPLPLLNGFLLYGAVGLVPARFFLQRSAGSDVRPYLNLPIRRARVVRILQVLSSLSLLNLIPILVLAALWGSTVVPEASALGAALWAVGALLLVAATQCLNSLLRTVWNRNTGLVLGAAGLLVALMIGSNWTGAGVLESASTWCFGGLAAGRILPLTVMIAGTAALAGAAHRMLRMRLHDIVDHGPASDSESLLQVELPAEQWISNRTGSLALLDFKLILRNKRSRQMMLLALGLVGIIAFNLVLVEESGRVLEDMNRVIFGYALTSMMGLQYGSFGYAWHGQHYDHLLLRTLSPRILVRAQMITLTGLCVASFLVALLVVGVVRPSLIVVLCAFLVYNVGVTVPALIGMAVWRREPLALREGAVLNYQGTSSGTFAFAFGVGAMVMGLPIGLTLVTSFQTTLIVVAGLGLLGIGTTPVWMQGLGALLWRHRYAMAAGFREE